MRPRPPRLAAATLAAVVAWGTATALHARSEALVVGSKNFAESRLLAELFARVIEERTGLTVERRFNMAGTEFCFEALRTGAIDLYPEYTGTGWTTLLGRPPNGSASEVLATLRAEFRRRWQMEWLAPLGFENAYELAVRREVAERLHLRSISDLVPVAAPLRAAFGGEFLEREDGLPGLERVYGLRLGDVRSMQETAKYRAAAAGLIDVLDVYSTDGRLTLDDLVVLEDDRSFFPPYDAVPLVRAQTLDRYPAVGAALVELAGSLDVARMRRANQRLQEDHAAVEDVAAEVMREIRLGSDGPADPAPDEPKRATLLRYLLEQRHALLRRTVEHVWLSSVSLLAGALVAVPTALWLARRRPGFAEAVVRAVGVTQTLPSLALLGFLIPLLGVGVRPALVALWLYSLYPMVRSSYSGVRDADPAAVEAATALGMTQSQVMRRVRLPLALPSIMAGVRTAAVINIGTATLAAFIGAGGLGEPIVAGLQLVDSRRILSGAIPAALLAVTVDFLLGRLERRLRPPGLLDAGDPASA